MSQPPSSNRVWFGPYELDFQAHILRKNGVPIRLQEQPWQVLCALVEKPGALVSRDELQKRLWSDGTFVDFEHSLNKAVNKLREALNDSADRPRYIETLARKGYRFVASVEVETGDEPVAPAAPRATKRNRRLWIAGSAALIALILITGLWPPPSPVTKMTLLTGDAHRKNPWLAVTGGRVLYSAFGLGKDASRGELWSVPTAGGEVRREPTPCTRMGAGTLLWDVSYTHKRLFLACVPVPHEADLWLTGFDGSIAKSMGHYNLLGQLVSISPDLETLLLSRHEGLFAKPVYGGAERQLARTDVWNFWSNTFWHPAGGRIGFLRKVDGFYKVWEVRADGTGARPLIPEFAGEQSAAQWSRDGQRLYFVSNGDIYLQRRRGWLGWIRRPKPVRLTSSSIQFVLPNEDPGNPLAVYSIGRIPQATAMKLDRKTNVWEPFLGGVAADCFNYSPDGQWIAYVSWSNAELWKCRKDGSGKVLLEDGLFCYGPRWSPDGTRIAFAARDRSATEWAEVSHPFHIYTIPANGGNPDPAPGVAGPGFDPTWSPDGKRLVYAPFCGEVPKERQRVSIVNLETGAAEALPGSDNLASTRWSPDGKWLTALSCDKDWPYVYNFATQKWTVLQPIGRGFPDWSSDSRSVYLTEGAPEAQLVRIEVATGKLEEVRKLSEFPITGLLGYGAFWTPDEDPVVLKNISSSQIYRIERDR